MIPKVIHFSWISNDDYPPIIRRCLDSWKKYAPDYEIVRWDKHRFDIDSLQFTRQAFERRKWAFIADVQRLYALYHHGGIYLDSDVELFKPLDPLLEHRAFIGFEDDELLSLGTLGSESGHPWIKTLLDYYNDIPFVNADGSLNNKPNTFIVTQLAREHLNLQPGGARQSLNEDVQVYPMTYFSPKQFQTGKVLFSADTYAIHHFSSSWMPWRAKLMHKYFRFKHQGKSLLSSLVGESRMQTWLDHKRRFMNK